MTPDRVMLLIDADNVSVDVVEQAVAHLLEAHGALHVRRAYCTAESALKHQAVFRRLSIKPMVNLSTGKNSTDIALAVDAVDLVLAERPDVVAIASSDSDFAPLVARLREKGCRVVGIGQEGKTGEETLQVYDEFTVMAHRRAGAAAAARPARKTAARGTAKTATKMAARAATQAEASPADPSAAETGH
ncbi:MAG TPA: NYN domain-containing protein, partial [Rubrivivax sp.]|nr:NYN domain-containing protein [Rubrivivax sp.]